MPGKRLSPCVLLLALLLSAPLLQVHARQPQYPGHRAVLEGGDGHIDLAVGVPGEDIGDAAGSAGAVNVIYAWREGFSTLYNQEWDQDDLWGDSEAEVFDAFGSALAAGDFDGDGWDDLAIGVPQEDVAIPGYVSNAGMVQVLYGSKIGLTTVGLQGWCQGGCSGLGETAEENDQFGAQLAAGDFNADGFDDLAVGVPNEDVGTDADAGAVNVIYGSPSGLSLLAAADDQVWNQDSPYVEGGAEPYDTFGAALAVGDFDGDGWDDLAVGVPGEDVGTINSAGAVNILYGSTYGLASVGNQIWDQDTGLLGESGDTDLFGYSLAAGDLNGDGRDDLAIGVRNEDVGAATAAGAVNVIYGSIAGLTATGNDLWNQDTGLDGLAESSDFFGAALTIGDLDGDGYRDLVVGVPREDVSGKADAGAINVIFGASGGLTAAGNVAWTEDDFYPGAAQAGDQFGLALAAGDMDGDGYGDLVIGVPYQDVGGAADAGAFDLMFGAADWPDPFHWAWGYSQNTPGIYDTAELQDHLGMELAMGDYRGFRIYLPLVTRQYSATSQP